MNNLFDVNEKHNIVATAGIIQTVQSLEGVEKFLK